MQVLRVGDPDAPDHDPEDNVRAVAGDGRRCVPGGGGGDRCGDGGPAVRARLTYPKVRERGTVKGQRSLEGQHMFLGPHFTRP